mgnify:CR=1 FL=1
MSKSFTAFKKQVLEQSGLAASLSLYGYDVQISEELDIIINGEKIKSDVNTLEEAREYAKRYIENIELLEDIDTTIPEEKVAHYTQKRINTLVDQGKLDEQKLNLFNDFLNNL